MNYYEILEVSVNASSEVVKNAYRALSKKYHPDRYKGDKSFAEEKLKEINIAYETLIDDEKRLQYDYDNGFKIDPNALVQKENEVEEKEEIKEEKMENKKDKSTWVIKKKNVVIAIVIAFAFILAFFIGLKLANTSEEKKEEKVIQTTTETDTPKKKDSNMDYNYNYNDNSSNKEKEDKKVDKDNNDIPEDEVEEIGDSSDYGDS